MLPEGWKAATFHDAGIKVVDGDRGKEYPTSSDFQENGYCLFLNAKNVSKNGFCFDEVQFIDKEKHLKLRKGIVNRGNIVLTTRGTLGQFGYYDGSIPYDVIRINSGMVVLDVQQSLLRSDFLYALCRSYVIEKQIKRASFGSAQPQLTVKIIKNIKIPVPPLPEQKKIAQILSTWDNAILATERLLANSQQRKKALMQQLLTGKKRLPGFEGEWVKKRLIDVVKIETGSSKSASVNDNGTNFIIDMGSVTRSGRLVPTKRTSLDGPYLVTGQLVMPKDDIGGGNIIGRVGVIPEDNKYILADHVYALTPLGGIDSHFLGYLINSDVVNKSLRRKANGTAQLGLGRKDVERQDILIPSDIREQKSIGQIILLNDQENELLQKRLDHLKLEKKALMQQLLTGKRRVVADVDAA